jgi:hypothetical protein
MIRLLGPTLAVLSLALPASARQGEWLTFDRPGSAGAGICPVDDEETANYFCVLLRCEGAGAPARIEVEYAGGDLLPGRHAMEVRVDGAPAGRVALAEESADGVVRLAAPYSPAEHGAIIQALRQGGAAVLTFTGLAPDAFSHAITLGGSNAALTFALRRCDARGAPSAPPPSAAAGGTALTAAEVRETLIGPRLYWGTDEDGVGTVYLPGGRFEGMMVNAGRGRAHNGSYVLRDDGRICWEAYGVRGCFRFYRDGDAIRVRRNDAASTADIGEVQVTR